MTGTVDLLTSRRILLLASNPAISGQTGWPIGFWWAELSHPYWEFTEHGYDVDIVSPEGGELAADPWSDDMLRIARIEPWTVLLEAPGQGEATAP